MVSIVGVLVLLGIIIVAKTYNRNIFCSCSGNCGDCLKYTGYLLTCGCLKKPEERRP